MAELANLDFRDAVHMASLSPATFLELESTKGSIKEDKDADLCIINNEDEYITTIINGDIVYKKDM